MGTITLDGHTDWVNAVAVTPNEKLAVSVSYDHTMKVWNVKTGELVKTVEYADNDFATCIAATDAAVVSGTSSGMSAGMFSGKVYVTDIATGIATRTIEVRDGWPTSVVITPDGSRAVVGFSHGAIKIYDIATGRLVFVLFGHGSMIRAMALNHNGAELISAGCSGQMIVWDLATGKSVRRLPCMDERVISMAVTPKHIIVGHDSGPITVLDTHAGRIVKKLGVGDGPVYSVAVTPDYKHAIAGSEGNFVRCWNIDTGKLVSTICKHGGSVRSIAATSSKVISGSEDNSVKISEM